MPVSFRPSPGRAQLEHLKLATNDPRRPLVYLSIRIEAVSQNIVWAPQALYLLSKPGTAPTAELRLVGPPELDVGAARGEPDVLDVRILHSERTETRQTNLLEVKLLGRLAVGQHALRLLIETAVGTYTDTIAVPVTVVVPELVRARPRWLVKLDLEPGEFEQDVLLDGCAPEPFEVVEATVEDVPLRVVERERLGAAAWRLRLAGHLPRGVYRGRLVVRLALPAQELVEMRLTLAVGHRLGEPD